MNLTNSQLLFISHSHAEVEIVEWLNENIEHVFANQIAVTATSLPKTDIPSGFDWLNFIVEKLTQAKVVIVLFTPASLNKPWIWFEMGVIWEQFKKANIRLMPVYYGMSPSSLIYPFSALQGRDLADHRDVRHLFSDLIKIYECGLLSNLKRQASYKPRKQTKVESVVKNGEEQLYRTQLLETLTLLVRSNSINEASLNLLEQSGLIHEYEKSALAKLLYR